MKYQAFSAPTDPYADEQAKIQQHLALAQILQQRGMEQPQGQVVSGHYVPTSITQNLAQLANAYMGRRQQDQALSESRALSQRAINDQSGAMAAILAEPDVSKRVSAALSSPLPAVQALGAKLMEGQMLRDNETFKAGLGAPPTRTVKDGNQTVTQEYDRESKTWREIGRGDSFKSDVKSPEAMAQAERIAMLRTNNGGMGPSSIQEWERYQAMPPDKKEEYLRMKRADMQINAGDRVIIPGRVDPTQPAATYTKELPPQDRPETKGAQKAAQITSEANAKRDFNMMGLGEVIADAEKIMGGVDPDTGKGAPMPTQSGGGAMFDAVSGFFGASPDGAPQADRLEAIGGVLVSKMPRMEGPQSNLDVDNYKTMAGRVGDRTLPVERRIEALKEVKRLWQKYDKGDDGWRIEEVQ